MKKNLGFRAWFYFRQGWSTYFAFILAALNTMVTTYYLAIKRVPTLIGIFPSFFNYLFLLSIIGVPLLIFIGYIHFKRIPAYSSETDITAETNPFCFKLPPGFTVEVLYPLYYSISNILVKLSKNEKLTDQEINEIAEIEKKINILIRGGSIGKPQKNRM